MFKYRGLFVRPSLPARGQLSVNSLILYAYDSAYVMDNGNYATVLESFVSTLQLQVAQVNTEKVSGLDHLVLAKKWGIPPEKALNTIHHTTQHWICTVLHPSLSRWFRTSNPQLWCRRLPHNVYSDTLFTTRVSRCNMHAQIFATNFSWLRSFLIKLKSEAQEALPLLFQQAGFHLQ